MTQGVARHIKLVNELSDLNLPSGQVGIVLNTWREPTLAHEVEFQTAGKTLRVLLLDHQVIMLNFDEIVAA